MRTSVKKPAKRSPLFPDFARFHGPFESGKAKRSPLKSELSTEKKGKIIQTIRFQQRLEDRMGTAADFFTTLLRVCPMNRVEGIYMQNDSSNAALAAK
ncbi:hypothetical protein [Paenibacillus konkukensis]|uniref:hypothetical protein n=1 Tax=Paenibacillus konkukensis TaxID=2020716 RepID=UPI00201DFE91|nr:hypothetical protein [Paenibacillus konkukensis]